MTNQTQTISEELDVLILRCMINPSPENKLKVEDKKLELHKSLDGE